MERTKLWLAALCFALIAAVLFRVFPPKSYGFIAVAILACLIGALASVMLLILSRRMTMEWEPFATIAIGLAVFLWISSAVQWGLAANPKLAGTVQAWFTAPPGK